MAKLQMLILCCWVLFAKPAVAQPVRISGSVEANGAPVQAATVKLGSRHVLTDSAGKFYLAGVSNGKKWMHVSASGHAAFDTLLIVQSEQISLDLQLMPQVSTIDEVVISGTMKPVSKTASPIPVEVYSPAFFRKNPSPAIFESLQMVNGVQPQLNCNVCNTGDIHINGMEGPYTMILIDGMPIVSSLSTVYGLAGIPNSMVKRIEIVKGPASTLYGSEAVGGLINIITRDASGADRWNLDVSGTSVGEYNADVAGSLRMKKAAALIGVNYFNYQRRRDINNDNFTDIALQQRLSVFNKWDYQLTRGKQASLAIRYITEDRWGGQMHWQPAFKGSDSVYGESIRTSRAELISTMHLSQALTLDVSYNYHLQDSYYGRVKYYANQQVSFAQLRWSKKRGSHDWLMGIPLRYTYYDDNTTATASATGRNAAVHSVLPGIFLQDEWKANSAVTVLMGMRYDYQQQHGHIITPRVALKYAPNSTHRIRLSGGNGYRVVNLFTEDHAALTGAREVIIAEKLQPEQSWNGNLNYSATVRHRKGFVNLDVSAFYTYFTNRIVADYFTDAGKIIYDNLKGHAVSKGISLNVDCFFTNGLKVTAGATWMDVYQVERGVLKDTVIPQLFAPKLSGTFSISYSLPRQQLTIDLTGRATGAMYLPVVPNDFRSDQSPAYCLANLQLSRRMGNGFELYTGVKNLLNFLPATPILHPDDPFNKPGGKYFDADGNARADTNPNGYTFDPSYNYAPVQGAKFYAGIRFQLK